MFPKIIVSPKNFVDWAKDSEMSYMLSVPLCKLLHPSRRTSLLSDSIPTSSKDDFGLSTKKVGLSCRHKPLRYDILRKRETERAKGCGLDRVGVVTAGARDMSLF